MRYFKVNFLMGFDCSFCSNKTPNCTDTCIDQEFLKVEGYQVMDDTSTCIGYIKLDGSPLELPVVYNCFIVDSEGKTAEEIGIV